ncbi:MAG: outer membrane protein transport protein [Venatoribacter sp.]
MYLKKRLLLAAGATLFSSQLMAAGLEITQHGVKEMGHAFAGTATLLEDASVVANNPAGLLRLNGKQFSGGLSILHAQLDYDVKVASWRIEEKYGLEPGEVSGGGKGQSNQLSPVPHLYYSQRLSEDSAVGIGLYVPFASGSSFPAGWAGRYHSEETSQQVININPVYAFRATESLSVGLGFIVQIYKAYLTNQIDVGYLVAESILQTVADDPTKGPDVANDLAEAVISKYGSNENYQVHNEIDLLSLTYGFNIGLLWEPRDDLRVGLNYRSGTTHIAKGKAKRDTLDKPGFKDNLVHAVAGDAGYLDNNNEPTPFAYEKLSKAFDERGAMGGDLETYVYLPQTINVSVNYQVSDTLDLMGSVNWADWSVFKEMRLQYPDDSLNGGGQIAPNDDVYYRRRDLVQPLNFKDSVRVGVAARWQMSNKIVLRTGASFDQSPLTDAAYRTPRGPDADRTIFGLGGSYIWTPNTTLDLSLGSIHLAKAKVSAQENPANTQHRAEGHSEGWITTLGLQFNHQF